MSEKTQDPITRKIDYSGQDWTLARAHKMWVDDSISEQDDNDGNAHAMRYNIPNRFRAWLAGDGLVAEGRDVDYEYPTEADYHLPIEDAEELTVNHHKGWYRALHEHGWASTTINSYHTLLSMWAKWMTEKTILEEDFHENLRKYGDPDDLPGIDSTKGFKEEQFKDEIQYASLEEVDEMCKYVTSPKIQTELAIRLMFQTGVREVELRNIELTDIDRKKRKIKIITAKNGKLRDVWYHPSLDMLMDRYLDVERDELNYSDSPYLFPTKYSPQMARNTPNQNVTECAEKAGIQDYTEPDASGKRRRRITAHALRHGFGVQCAKNGMHIKSIQELLGHQQIEQTKKYIQFATKDVKNQYDHYGPMESKL
ncbi:site-specific integrase [Halobacteria archaeon HArc-gm2]|nr:site-specific integrase [Halobacteria archaeon HArc-gm2]